MVVGVGPRSAHAQQTPKIPQVGRLSGGFGVKALQAAFSLGLGELGYVEGQNIIVDYRYAEGKSNRAAELAADLVRKKVDVIVAGSDATIWAAHQATATIPIVMVWSSGPLARGLVESLARPGGNITGVTSYYPEARGKTLEIFKEAFPKLRRVAMVWNPANPGHSENLKEVVKAARALEMRLEPVAMQSLDDIENVFSTIIKVQADGIFLLNSPFIRTHSKRVNEFTEKRRLPTMYRDKLYVEGGGLMSYGTDNADLHRRAAVYVDKILKGAKPAELPVERSTKIEFVINLKTAKQMGLTIPPAVLMDADRVIR
jgi:putative ABC transport system substrate-binding protein